MKIVTAQQMRNLDRRTIEECGIPGIVLMENAGRGTAEFMAVFFPRLPSRRIAVMSGRGNNGGDGFVIARYLKAWGTEVRSYLLSQKNRVGGDAKTNLDIFLRSGGGVQEIVDAKAFENLREEIGRYDLYVDAIFGTGLDSDVTGFHAGVIDFLNGTGKPIVAVDIPSGLDANTGKPLGTCIKATLTTTFGFPKLGQILYPGAAFVGTLETIDIGIPSYLVEEEEIKNHLIEKEEIWRILGVPRPPDSHKGNYGHLLVVAGSVGKTGAAAMACESAMRIGAGLVTLGIPESLNPILEAKLIETMTVPLRETKSLSLGREAFEALMALAQGKSAVALGPGISTTPETVELVQKLVRSLPIPMVIDADGITAVAAAKEVLRDARAPVILTPHPGEMARLIGKTSREVQEDRIGVAREFSSDFRCHVILKGARTVVSTPSGEVFINPTGNPGMASGGTGDVLTGMLGGLVCQGLSLTDSAKAAVYLHGRAGDLAASKKGERSLIATDLIEMIPALLKDMESSSLG